MAVIDFAASLDVLLNILKVAIGLGMVIFFHELGHFLVAKWCGVYVERFSIGFGQPIFARKWGETEYALGWLPFGGYVKMLGQDDMDPGQMADEQIADNPRSYTAKNVPQRMAIISAGVTMNIITGLLFFMLAFRLGVMKVDHVVGDVSVGMPAWENGIRTGDTLTSINNRKLNSFEDILFATLSSDGPLHIVGFHPDGETFDLTFSPEKTADSNGKIMGAGLPIGLRIPDLGDRTEIKPAWPGTAAAGKGFQYGDRIVAVDDTPVSKYVELIAALQSRADQPVAFHVKRKESGSKQEKEVTLNVPPELFVGLGLKMQIGKITDIKLDSPAARAGLKVGDRIAKFQGQDVEKDLDPARLTEAFSAEAGQEVTVVVTREVEGASQETLEIQLTPEDRAPWSEPPVISNSRSPFSIPSIGVAYEILPTVFSVEEGSQAAAKIHPRDTITKVELVRPKNAKESARDQFEKSNFEIKIGESSWPYAFWMMQEAARTRVVRLTVQPANASETVTVELTPQKVDGWYLPTTRGLALAVQSIEQKASNLSEAATMGTEQFTSSIRNIYLTLRGLFTGNVSAKAVSGPIGIFGIAYTVAGERLAQLLIFLGIISVNLAVINFLPIPVLDGGHMVFLLWEGIFRRKPSEQIVTRATYAGLMFILTLMICVIYLDIAKFF